MKLRTFAVRGCALLVLLVLLAWCRVAAADGDTQERFERRGERRAGIALFTAGVSALPSSLALYETTDHRMGLTAATVAIGGHLMMGAGIPLWVAGAQGKRTHPRNATVMYAGMAVAYLGFAALPASSVVLVASLEPGISDDARSQRRLGALVGFVAASTLVGAGIPFWAWGAASPDDWRAQTPAPRSASTFVVEPYPFGVRGNF